MRKISLFIAVLMTCITLTSCEEKKVVNNNPPNQNQNVHQKPNSPEQS